MSGEQNLKGTEQSKGDKEDRQEVQGETDGVQEVFSGVLPEVREEGEGEGVPQEVQVKAAGQVEAGSGVDMDGG